MAFFEMSVFSASACKRPSALTSAITTTDRDSHALGDAGDDALVIACRQPRCRQQSQRERLEGARRCMSLCPPWNGRPDVCGQHCSGLAGGDLRRLAGTEIAGGRIGHQAGISRSAPSVGLRSSECSAWNATGQAAARCPAARPWRCVSCHQGMNINSGEKPHGPASSPEAEDQEASATGLFCSRCPRNAHQSSSF